MSNNNDNLGGFIAGLFLGALAQGASNEIRRGAQSRRDLERKRRIANARLRREREDYERRQRRNTSMGFDTLYRVVKREVFDSGRTRAIDSFVKILTASEMVQLMELYTFKSNARNMCRRFRTCVVDIENLSLALRDSGYHWSDIHEIMA